MTDFDMLTLICCLQQITFDFCTVFTNNINNNYITRDTFVKHDISCKLRNHKVIVDLTVESP